MTYRELTKEEWIEKADEVKITLPWIERLNKNKWIARLAPKCLEMLGFYVYSEGGKTFVMVHGGKESEG